MTPFQGRHHSAKHSSSLNIAIGRRVSCSRGTTFVWSAAADRWGSGRDLPFDRTDNKFEVVLPHTRNETTFYTCRTRANEFREVFLVLAATPDPQYEDKQLARKFASSAYVVHPVSHKRIRKASPICPRPSCIPGTTGPSAGPGSSSRKSNTYDTPRAPRERK